MNHCSAHFHLHPCQFVPDFARDAGGLPEPSPAAGGGPDISAVDGDGRHRRWGGGKGRLVSKLYMYILYICFLFCLILFYFILSHLSIYLSVCLSVCLWICIYIYNCFWFALRLLMFKMQFPNFVWHILDFLQVYTIIHSYLYLCNRTNYTNVRSMVGNHLYRAKW